MISYIRICENMTSNINDSEIQSQTKEILSKIKYKVSEFEKQKRQIMEDDYFSERGKREKIRQLAKSLIEDIEKYKSNSLATKKKNMETVYQNKLSEELKPDPSKGQLYSEIRTRLINRVGDDSVALRSEFLKACSRGDKTIANALLSDPFQSIDKQTKEQGLKLLAGNTNNLENNPQYKALSTATSIVNGVVKHIMLQLNKQYQADPVKSFDFSIQKGGLADGYIA